MGGRWKPLRSGRKQLKKIKKDPRIRNKLRKQFTRNVQESGFGKREAPEYRGEGCEGHFKDQGGEAAMKPQKFRDEPNKRWTPSDRPVWRGTMIRETTTE